MLPKNDSLLIGLITGLVISTAGYFIALGANEWVSSALNKPFAFKDSTVALFAIVLNMLAVGFFRRRFMHKSLRGLMFLMMGLAVVWFIVYGQALMEG